MASPNPNPYTSKVFDKLAQLKQWQCEQHERLVRDQEEQRRLLNEAQSKRLQNLGLENTDAGRTAENVVHEDNFELPGVTAFSTTDSESEEIDHEEQTTSVMTTTHEETLGRICDSEIEEETKTRPKMLFIDMKNDEAPTEKPKRRFTFLKRGEGLSRFRLTPQDIALQNKRIQASKKKPGALKAVNNVNKNTGAVSKVMTSQMRSSTVKPGEGKTAVKKKMKRKAPVVSTEAKMMVPRSASLPLLQLDASKPVQPKIMQPPSHSSNGFSRPSWNANVTDLPPLFGPVLPKLCRSNTAQSKSDVVDRISNTARFVPVSNPTTRFPPESNPTTQPVPVSNPTTQPAPASNPTTQRVSVYNPNLAAWVGNTAQAHFIPSMPVPPGGHDATSWSAMFAQAQMNSMNNTSDSTKRVELKELRMFEKLERIAADSSFCSSSSVVTKFVEGGYLSSSVQSTPQVTPSKQPHSNLVLPDTSTPFSNETMDNARTLLEKLAAFRFAGPAVNQNSDLSDSNKRMLYTHLLQANERTDEQEQPNNKNVQPTDQHVRFQEQPEVREVESDTWSESGEEDTSLETDTESEATQLAESSNEEEQHSGHGNEAEQLVIGSLVHTRLEQLQTELINVQTQQAALTAQRTELTKERRRLADAVSQTKEERKKLEGERKNLGVTTRKKQAQDREKIDQLQKQLTELQCAWSEREARWSAAQASQRSQLRQISLENKELALQINQLKEAHTKKVQFAPVQRTQPTRPPAKRNERCENETNLNRRKTVAVFSSASAEDLGSNHHSSQSASSSLPLYGQSGPSEARHYEPRPSEARHSEPRPSEARHYEPRPSEARHYEPRSSEARYCEPRPSETRHYEPRPSEARHYEPRPSEARHYKPRPSETRPYETRPSEARNYEPRPSETRSSEVRPSEAIHSEPRPSEMRHSEPIPSETVRSEASYSKPGPSEAGASGVSRDIMNLKTGRLCIINLDDVDTLIAKYKVACNIDPSPSSSLVLNTPRGIKKAYNTIFHANSVSNDESMLEQASGNSAQSDQRVTADREINPIQISGNQAENKERFSKTVLDLATDIYSTINSDTNVYSALKSVTNIYPALNSASTNHNSRTNVEPNQNSASTNHNSRTNVEPIQNSASTNHNSRTNVKPIQNSASTNYNSRTNVEPIQNSEERVAASALKPEYVDQRFDISNPVEDVDSNTRDVNEPSLTNDYLMRLIRQSRNYGTDRGQSSTLNEDPVSNCNVKPQPVEVDTSGDLTDYHEYQGNVLLEENNGEVSSSIVERQVRKGKIPCGSDVCKEVVHEDGTHQRWFVNGNTLKLSADHNTSTMLLTNGDMTINIFNQGLERYYYARYDAWHEKYDDGTQVFTYKDGRKVVIFPSGHRTCTYADGSVIQKFPDGREEGVDAKGVRLVTAADGTNVLYLPNGNKETRGKELTKLESPDGTVKTKYPSGLLETIYPDGRIRIRDASGRLLVDTHQPELVELERQQWEMQQLEEEEEDDE